MQTVEGAYEMMLASSQISMSFSSWKNPYITDGLVAMWDGEWNAGPGKHNASANSWIDLSINHLNATKYGDVIWEKDCAVMNGTNAYFLTQNEIDLEDLTFEACIKSDDALYDRQYVSWNIDTNEKAGLDWLENKGITQLRTHFGHGTSGSIKGWSYNNSGNNPMDGATATLRYSNEYLRFSINGTNVYSTSISPLATPTDKRVMIGAYMYSTTAGAYYKGRMFCIRIYNRTLDDNEISMNYAVDLQRFSIS